MLKNFKFILVLFLSFISAGFLWSIINIFLVKVPTNLDTFKKDNTFFYIHLEKIFLDHHTIKIKHKKITKLKITLKAIFENGENSFIIIKDKQDKFLNIGDIYKGFKLIKVTKNSAIFEKNNKMFEVTFKEKERKYNYVKKSEKTPQYNLSKQEVISYTSNLSKIWENIAIIKTKDGYKITYIKPHSIFDKIGLKRGDILLEVNDKKLNSDADAWQLYKNFKQYNEFLIKIKRNNKIKELDYEIN